MTAVHRSDQKSGGAGANTWSSQQRNSHIALQDEAKPGRCRLITLWLVDPNIPPQKLAWWAGAVLGGNGRKDSGGKLPPELLEVMLRQLTKPRALSDAVKRLGLSERDFTTLTGHRGYCLPVELVEKIHQHQVLPAHTFSQPAC